MKTVFNIIKYELKERVFTWLSLIFFLMLVFQGVWYTKGTFDYYVNDGVLINAPAIFYRNFAGNGMLMVIIVTIVTGGVLYKDIQYKTAQWMYTMPIKEKSFFVGRYLAAFLYLLILSSGYFLGMLLVPYSGIGLAHRFGPAPVGQMLHAVGIFLIPNLLLFVSLILSAVVLSKRMAVGYLASFLIIILFLVMQTSYEAGGPKLLYFLLEPMGYVALENYFEYLTTEQKNTGYVTLTGYVLQNRLIWFGVSAGLFLLAYRKFSFKEFIKPGNSHPKKVEHNEVAITTNSISVAIPQRSYTTKDFVVKLFSLARLEILNIVRPTSFRIIIGILMLMILMQNLMWNASYYIGPELPLSSNMTFFRLPWGVFILMLLMIWSGELFFKDKIVRIWQITDALPVPVWVSQLSRLLASFGLALTLCLCFIIICVFCQILMGGVAYIDIQRYIVDLLGFRWGWLNFVLFISLVFFIAGLTGNRFITHILSVGYFLITIISFDMGLTEEVRYGYALVPGVEDYSEVSGYGIYETSAFWFALMWLLLALVFVMLGLLFWDRGLGKKWYQKLSLGGNQLNVAGKVMVGVCLLAFLGLQAFINKQVYQNGNFTSKQEEEKQNAEYEKKYKYLQRKSQPIYQHVNLNFNFYPSLRKADYTAELQLKNSTYTDTLFLNFKDFVSLNNITINQTPLQLLKADSTLHIFAYSIPTRFRKDSLLILRLQATKQYVGFTQSDLQSDLTFEGSFGYIKAYLPVIGYDADKELTENRTRQDNGLVKLASRMSPVSDTYALSQDVFANDAQRLSGVIHLSTEKEQVAFAPGKLTKKYTQANRNYYIYTLEKAAPFEWYLATGNYQTPLEGRESGVAYSIISDKKHPFNLKLYENAIRAGLKFFNTTMGASPVSELRLIEINHWGKTLYNAPNLIAISEKEGWVADTSHLKERSYIYHTIGSQLAAQYLLHKLPVANVQGAGMLKTALPEALGLQFVKQTLGKEAAELLIKKKTDRYSKERNNEPNQEPVLLYADGADYLEANKGAVSLYRIMEEIGKDDFMETLRSFSEDTSNKTFSDFFDKFKTRLSQPLLDTFTSNRN